MSPEQACPNCGRVVETAGLEPFGKVTCPHCSFQLRVERTFENYRVVEPLGIGGMGSVYKACDTRLHRFVALKLLRREFADDKAFRKKLQDEARITASIKHPHVVEVFSVGREGDEFYLVMELVDGGSLDDRMEDEKRIPERRALEVGLQVAQGLQAALQAGLIHRDIKPGNILFADAQTAKIVDFGLAALAEHRAESDDEIWGTPYYVAPERLTNSREDFRSDLYSLGATLFHAIAGRPTFESETLSAAELKKLKADPVSLREAAPDVAVETAAVIDRMLRSEPSERHQSYKELIGELQAARAAALAREGEGRARLSWPKRVLVSLGGVALIAAAILAIDAGWKDRPPKTAATAPAPVAVSQEKIAVMRRDPEKVLPRGRELAAKSTKGALASDLTDKKTSGAANVAADNARRSEAEKELAAAEAPTWQAAQFAARKMMASYRFGEAVAILQSAKLTATSLRTERDDAVHRAQWLADWKTKLINDINQTGYGGAVTDIHGVRYDGPVRKAGATEMELKTRYGTVMTNWLNLSPQMLLAMSIAFIRPAAADIPERRWLCAIFAAETGQSAPANDLAQKAAATDPEFRELRLRFFPGVK